MVNAKEKKSKIETAAEDLFNFAIEREDVKYLLTLLPEEADINRVKVEYELPILKIISVGWAITYHLESNPVKEPLSEIYWKAIYEFSQSLSETTGLMIGQDIDYFRILRERLDLYVDALSRHPELQDPARIIGPEFAKTCGNIDDLFTSMTGSKMFFNSISRVDQYLETAKLK
jgi:hypothetical protein